MAATVVMLNGVLPAFPPLVTQIERQRDSATERQGESRNGEMEGGVESSISHHLSSSPWVHSCPLYFSLSRLSQISFSFLIDACSYNSVQHLSHESRLARFLDYLELKKTRKTKHTDNSNNNEQSNHTVDGIN